MRSPEAFAGKLFDSLLLAPDVHYQVHRQVLHQPDLPPHRGAQDGDGLAFFQVLHSLPGNFVGFVPVVYVLYVVVVLCVGLELCFYPARTHAHDADAPVPQFSADGPGKAENIALAGAVDGLIGHRLPGGVGAHIDYMAARLHIGQARMAHCRQRKAVELGAGKLGFQVLLFKGAEHAAARGIDEHGDLRPGLGQELLVLADAVRLIQVETNREKGIAALFPQLFQTAGPPGDGPYLIIFILLVDGKQQLPANAGACAGNNGNFQDDTPRFLLMDIS